MLVNYTKRAFLWCVLYYGLIIFSVFYLREKIGIINWDMTFVFVPLLFLAISSESMTRKKELNAKILRPYSILDFSIKCVVYILAQLAYRRILIGTFFYIDFAVIVIALLVSLFAEFMMLRIAKRNNKH